MLLNEKTIELWLIDAFAERPFAGNRAGVVLDGDALSTDQMQAIANEVNASETVFVTASEGTRFKLRFFTPEREVDYCGHAVVAVMSALAWAGRILVEDQPVTAQITLKIGDLPIELRPRGGRSLEVISTQAAPRFAPFERSLDLLAGCLGIERAQIPAGWPLGLAYTGLWALVVPLPSRPAIDAARPDFASLAELNRKIGVVSTHLYTYQGPNELYCRDFSPAAGVFEDPVTGSAIGATAALLVKEGALKLTPPVTHLTADQGHAIGRPGRARIEVTHNEGGVERVRVAGSAVLAFEGRIRLP